MISIEKRIKFLNEIYRNMNFATRGVNCFC